QRRQIAGRCRGGGPVAGDRLGDPADQISIDHLSDDGPPAGSASAVAVRAATIGERRTRSSGAPSGSSRRVKATRPPLSRTISVAAATSTQRHGPSGGLPSTRPPASWPSEG